MFRRGNNYEYLRGFIYSQMDTIIDLSHKVESYRKEIQSNDGRFKLLEDQQNTMHNFLVEINKYLVKLSENKNKEQL